MRTRKRRRDYKSLEDGKDDSAKGDSDRRKRHPSKESRGQRNHVISIDTNHLKPSEKGLPRAATSQPAPITEGVKTTGRWTNEEHNKFVEALK